MNIINFLTKLANNLPNSAISCNNIMLQQTIQRAIEANDSNMLKMLLTEKISFMNERTVTVYP